MNHRLKHALGGWKVLLSLIVMAVSAAVEARAEVLIDDFNDGTVNQNLLGGFTGSFANDTGTCVESPDNGAMALTFSREDKPESFSGFFSQLGSGSGTVNAVAADVNALAFQVRGDLVDGQMAGGQNFQIEIKDADGNGLVSALSNVPGSEAGAGFGSFFAVEVPFSVMMPSGQAPVDLTRLREVVIAFNREFTEPNVSGTSRILIEDVRFTKRANPPENILSADPDATDIDLIGGSSFFAGPSSLQMLNVIEDSQARRGSAAKLYHNLDDSGDYFGFLAFKPSSPIDLNAAGVKTVTYRMRHTGVNPGPSRVVLELKHQGATQGTVLVHDVGAGAGEQQYERTVFPVYSSSSLIDEVVIVFYDGGKGAFVVDELAFSTDAYQPQNPAYSANAGPALGDEALLDYVQSRSAAYFIRETIGINGLVRDRSHPDSPASVAATGFGLSVLTVIAQRFDPTPGRPWHITDAAGQPITPEEAGVRASRMLDHLLSIQDQQVDLETGQGDTDRRYGIAGFFYHFLQDDGARFRESEVSVIDTAILVGGALQAGEYFGGDVKVKAEQLFRNVKWDFVFFAADQSYRLAWMPSAQRGFSVPDPSGIGFLSDGIIGRPTDELLMVNLLALASDPGREIYQQALFSYPRVERVYQSPSGQDFRVVNSFFGSAFTYIYAQLYYPFDALGPDRPDLITHSLRFGTPVDWWQNSMNAIMANRQFAIDRSAFFPFSFHANSWGMSAVERPDGAYEGLYGAPPMENGPTHDGTVAPYVMFSALPFFRTGEGESLAQNTAFQAIRYGYENRFSDLFGAYGPVDSYNDKAEFSTFFLGLDQGPIVLSIENYRSGLVQNTLAANALVRAALDIAFGHAPLLSPVPAQTVAVGVELTFTLSATDEDGDPNLGVVSESLPSGAALTEQGAGSALFRWTPQAADVGVKAVIFRARDIYRSSWESLTVTITVEGDGNPVPAPQAAFSASPVSGAAPLAVQFTDASTGDISGREWNFGDGGTSVEASPSHTYAQPGTYTVSLTVSGPGGSDTEISADLVTVSPSAPGAPVAAFTATPLSGDAPLAVAFADASTGQIDSREWDFGDGTAPSAEASPAHTYTEPGTYTVKLTVQGPGGSDVEAKTDLIHVTEPASEPAPVAAFSGEPTQGVAPLTVAFTNASTGAVDSRSWSFGDGASSTEQNPTHTYTQPGTYAVSLSVAGPGGQDTEAKPAYIVVASAPNPGDKAPVVRFFAFPASIYAGHTSVLVWRVRNAEVCEASSTPSDPAWTGAKPRSGMKLVRPKQTTTYTLTCRGSGGETSQSVQVKVKPKTPKNKPEAKRDPPQS